MKNSKTHFKKAVLKLIQAHTSRSYQVFSPDMKRYLAAGHTSSLQSNQKRISTQVVGQVSQADCCCCPQETDASQYRVTCTLGLDAKDMLNPGTSLCASPIPSLFPIGELLFARTLPLNMLSIAHLLQPVDLLLRAIGRISPDISAGILRIKQFFKHVAVMHFRTAHRITTDQLVFHISRDMVFVAKEIPCHSSWSSGHRYLSGCACDCSSFLACPQP